jgi:hypothetical protein
LEKGRDRCIRMGPRQPWPPQPEQA